MAIGPPRGFPEKYWLPVVATEAAARGDLILALENIPWQSAGGQRFLSWDAIKKAALNYASTLAGAFADQACLAARNGDLSLATLDASIDTFVDVVLHHAWGLDLPKIKATWQSSRHVTFAYEMKPRVMAEPW